MTGLDLFDRAALTEIEAERQGDTIVRPYQGIVVNSVYDHWAHGKRSTMVQMATGTGKTFVFSQIIDRFPRRRGRVLVLVNREELVDQSVAEIYNACPAETVEVEHQERRAARKRTSFRTSDGSHVTRSRIVVASKDTLWRRVKEFDPDEFGLIVIDECHHWTRKNKTYQSIVDYFRKAVIVGFTATPIRGDGVDLGTVFESVAATYSLSAAIEDGWLVPIVQKYSVIEGYDPSTLRPPKTGADWSPVEVDKIWRQEASIQSIVATTIKLATEGGDRRRTVAFMGTVAASSKGAEIANRWHAMHGTGLAASITEGTDPEERKRAIKAFRRGELTYLFNYGTLTEGFDVSDIRLVVMGRLTKNIGLYEQMLGRGMRPSRSITKALNQAANAEERKRIIASSIKKDVWVLDPVGVTGHHHLVMDATDVVGYDLGQDVIEEMKKASIRSNGTFRTLEEREEAKRRIEEYNEAERKRRETLIWDHGFAPREVDPFDKLNGFGKNVRGQQFTNTKPSAEQVSLLSRIGFKGWEIDKMTHSEAQGWIRKAMGRRRSGLCSIGKYRYLKSLGYDPENMTDQMASATLDRHHGKSK